MPTRVTRTARCDDFSSNRHRALSFCLRMIFSENRYPLFRIMHLACIFSSGMKDPRVSACHRVDRTACGRLYVRIAPGHRKRVSQNRLDHEAIGCRRQSETNAEIHVQHTELEIGYGEQSVLLVGKLWEVAYFAKIRIIFETHEQIL